jgi:hypothetical protein
MTRLFLCLSLIASAVLFSACAQEASYADADVIYTNGKIYTVNEAQPWVEAVAI